MKKAKITSTKNHTARAAKAKAREARIAKAKKLDRAMGIVDRLTGRPIDQRLRLRTAAEEAIKRLNQRTLATLAFTLEAYVTVYYHQRKHPAKLLRGSTSDK